MRKVKIVQKNAYMRLSQAKGYRKYPNLVRILVQCVPKLK